MAWPVGFGAFTSLGVIIPRKPGTFSAADESTLTTFACGIGLSISLMKAIPSARKSSEYLAAPVTFASISGGVKFLPRSL